MWSSFSAKDLGARTLWTVHNIPPHDSRFEDVDIELRRAIAGVADRIHLMGPRTRELVAPWFEIPKEKTFVVPHPGTATATSSPTAPTGGKPRSRSSGTSPGSSPTTPPPTIPASRSGC